MKFQCSFAWIVTGMLIAGLIDPLQPSHAQEGCGDAPLARLTTGGTGIVAYTDGLPLNIREAPGLTSAVRGELPEGSTFTTLDGPQCMDNLLWWQIQSDSLSGWVAEGSPTSYFVAPLVPIAPLANDTGLFATWDWDTFIANSYETIPDPWQIAVPAVYAGNLPSLPINLNTVQFVEDAQLNDNQRALLAQNGFVVVPAGFTQFDQAYRDTDTWWSFAPPDYPDPTATGHGSFVTTDATLHALHYIFDNLLTDLEYSNFQPAISDEILVPMLQAAHQQTAAVPAELAQPAQDAELFLVVALELFKPGTAGPYTSPEILETAQPIIAMAMAGEGLMEIPFLPDYQEDFSQYRPRGHYEDDPLLQQYFRGMMWVSRITFLTQDTAPTQMALLLLRALCTAPDAMVAWTTLHETLTFLIGPVDDLGPQDYGPLAASIFGADLPLSSLADPTLIADFQNQAALLPGPRVNGLVLPRDTAAEDVVPKTRGFRLMGQRFTFDGFAMQQLIYPFVGTFDNPRVLPFGLDIASTIGGSPTAQRLAIQAGAGQYLNYDIQSLSLAAATASLSDNQWLENIYGGWLWTLRPLWNRSSASYPPMMNTDAWWRHDLQTGLASWTELKHDTVLYVKQPTGFGGGGGGISRPYGYVEPNPLVFARISILATLLYQGLTDRGYRQPISYGSVLPSNVYLRPVRQQPSSLETSLGELRRLAFESAGFAEIARKELAGEALTEEDYWAIFGFGSYLNVLLRTLWQQPGEPDPVALVTDVANDPNAGVVLQEAVSGVDYIYVVVSTPTGSLQVMRGGVFSYYEWAGDINQRMTDSEWRDQVTNGTVPPRPAWTSSFFSD
jgi:hypothetical protein